MDKQREIKFQRVYEGFMDENKGQINMREWGPLQSDASFIGPSYLLGYRFVCDRQYTGLKDKNGKEIYEGDIVTSNEKNNNPHGHIYFKEGCFVWSVDDNPLNCEAGDMSCHIETENWATVIGNIYETPELLTH